MEGARAGARNGRDCNLIGPARRMSSDPEPDSNQTRIRPARDPREIRARPGGARLQAALADSLVWYSQAL